MRFPILARARRILRSTTLQLQERIDRATRRTNPRNVLARLNGEVLSFFDKRPPFAEKYPYEVHYAPTLTNVPQGLESFHLIGRSWRRRPEAPLAVAFGFNMWKYGFIADYCPDVRIAFAARKNLGWRAKRALERMRPQPERIYVWGYTDPKWIARHARRRGIQLVRVEDAFLRSADLGANHATPYSLVFDTKGLYYNTGEPNDLADILSTHDFAGDADLMRDAERARALIVENGLSKYNLPDTSDPAKRFRIKARRRVLVIGQVDNDAAVRLGNPDGWRPGDIIRLARLENPDAEILYRPHPEVYRGHQRSRFKSGLVANIAEIVPPDGSLVDLLATTDQVYTISSLSGLEALIRGVTVTTLGTPFYAGWGATDDRVAKPRGRTLTPLEIFAASYLLYPRYLVCSPTHFQSIEALALRVLGEKESLRFERSGGSGKRPAPLNPENSLADDLMKGSYPDTAKPLSRRIQEILELFRRHQGVQCHRVILSLLARAERSPSRFAVLLEAIIEVVDVKAANLFLLDDYTFRPGSYHGWLFSTLVSRSKKTSDPVSLFHSFKRYGDGKSEADGEALAHLIDPHSEAERLRQSGRVYEEAIRIEPAIASLQASTLADLDAEIPYQRIAELSLKNFDYQSAYSIAYLYLRGTSQASPWTLRLLMLAGPYVAPEKVLADSALYAARNISALPPLAVRLRELGLFNNSASAEKSFLSAIQLTYGIDVPYVHALHEMGLFSEALDVSEAVARRDNSYQSAVIMSKSLCFLDRYDEAREIVWDALKVHKTKLLYDEALKICIYTGDYLSANCILKEAESLSIDVGEVLPRKIYFGIGKIEEAFDTFKEYHIKRIIQKAYPDHYIFPDNELGESDQVLVLPIFGPGDEIRFASTYEQISDHFPCRVIIGCEPRLFELVQRSFGSKAVNIVPVHRVLRDPKPDLSLYADLPSSEMMVALDSRAHHMVKEGSKVVLATDLLADFLTESSSFHRTPYLRADRSKTSWFRSQLPSHRLLVGINWRSSVTHQTRNEHYLSIDDLAPIFENTDIQFVNLQYDDCVDELMAVEKRFPGRLLNIASLDQYNDLDGVAALMSAVDLVVAPCTTVAELAGALGRPTWLLANSSETRWRRLPGNGDIWHGSMIHIEGETFRNKSSLVSTLVDRLNSWAYQAEVR